MKKNNSIQEIVEVIKRAQKPLFISHENPDGDTYGASFGLRSGIDKKDCAIACVSEVEWPFTELKIAGTVSDISEIDTDLYVFLDCADEHRCGGKIEHNLKEGVTTVNIDHHQSNTYFGDYNFVFERSSTCEIIFDILMEYTDTISKETADYLYMGVASDSGLFVHGYTTPGTHYTAAKLLEAGAEFDHISKILFRTVSMGSALLTGRLFANLEIIDDKIALSHISEQDFKDCNSDYNDGEALISYLTNIDKMQICILLKQVAKDAFKASMRSTKDCDISLLAVANGGGGHKQAAGCRFTGSIEDIKKNVINQIHELGIA